MPSLPPRKRRRVENESTQLSKADVLDEADFGGLEDSFAQQASLWNLELNYENRQKRKKDSKESTRLPIKTSEGRLLQNEAIQDISENETSSNLESDASDRETPPTDDSGHIKSGERYGLSSKEQIKKAKEDLAKLADQLAENPEENIGNLHTLADITSSTNATTTKLGLVTQAQVYKDIIPSYRIRPLSSDDQKEKVSKEVRKLRSFEQALVYNYRSYTKELSRLANLKIARLSEEASSLASVAISCACSLVISIPHFNFRTDLLQLLINRLSNKRVDQDFIACEQALRHLLKEDDDGKPSLEAVNLLAKMMKLKDYNIDERVLNIFLHMRLLSEFSRKASTSRIDKTNNDNMNDKKANKKRHWEHRSKKQRKLIKEDKAIEKEFKEADAVVGSEEREKQQGEALKLILGIYFRILKARLPNLMGPTLEGLSRYAHLINQDLFGDVLESLKDLIRQANITNNEDFEDLGEESEPFVPTEETRNTTRESLLAIITAFTLLQGQDVHASASSLGLDLNFFITHLWTSLMPVCLDESIESSSRDITSSETHESGLAKSKTKVNIRTTIVLLLRSLHAILLPANTRSVPPVRLAGLIKQLMTASLQLPEKSCQAMIGFAAQVVKSHRRRVTQLWYSEERRGDGVFNPLSSEVESSNPFTTTCFEGELLRLHYSPDVREACTVLEDIVVTSQ